MGEARERSGKRAAALEGETAQLSMQYQWEAEQLRGALREESEKNGKMRALAAALERSNSSMKSEGKQHLATLEQWREDKNRELEVLTGQLKEVSEELLAKNQTIKELVRAKEK